MDQEQQQYTGILDYQVMKKLQVESWFGEMGQLLEITWRTSRGMLLSRGGESVYNLL
jgi:hypothetical protein